MTIELIPITSSGQIAGLGYDPEAKVMRVRFTDYFHKTTRTMKPGALYDVEPVSQEQFDAFMAAKSKGSHYHATFKNDRSFTITKVENP